MGRESLLNSENITSKWNLKPGSHGHEVLRENIGKRRDSLDQGGWLLSKSGDQTSAEGWRKKTRGLMGSEDEGHTEDKALVASDEPG
jgi:hypothetical protein